MADPIYEIQQNPPYDTQIRALQDNDPARATTVFNPLMLKTINNTHHVKLKTDALGVKIEEATEAAAKSAKAYSHTVTATGWVKGASSADGSYWQEFSVANPEIIAGDVILVFPGNTAAEAIIKSCVRSYTDTYAGGFKLYANSVPGSNFSIFYTINKQEV